MTQQLSLFAEPTTDEPTEGTPRALWDKRLGNPSTSSGHRFENWLRSLNPVLSLSKGRPNAPSAATPPTPVPVQS